MGVRAAWFEMSARRWISELSAQIGVAGWTALAATPALAAEVDQHGAAVRDILLLGVEGAGSVAGVVLLAAYGRGLLDSAREAGEPWHPTADSASWRDASWLSVRLLAVCQLGQAHDAEPLTDQVPALPELT